MASPLIDGLAASPDIFIHNFDIAGDRALIIRLSAAERRKASFLDDRVLGPGVEGGWAAWSDIEPAAARAPKAKATFIFHIGHCGSTLVSKLIEEASGARTLREPQALRTFATTEADLSDGLALWSEAEFEKRLALWLNVASKGEQTIVKATSWCGALCRRSSGAALFCCSKPDAYIATMLGAANNPIDLKLNAPIRLRRLRRLCGTDVARLADLSMGELAAMSWAAEAATMAAPDPARFHAIEFDSFLAKPAEGLAAAMAHLGLPADAARIKAALAGPLMRTYSKDATFDYSPEDRQGFLAEYRAAHQGEIARGMKWLDAAAKAHASVAAGLARFS
ncbi:MAG: hypothetical protein HXY21_04045 [Parvularculaceae bacterium]|nr:hypothetical protein [Parvularculaceae bacterium]